MATFDIHAVPAYGRDYKSKTAVLTDWKAGKDFRDALSGRYLSIRDFGDNPPMQIWIRYQRQTKMIRVL